MSDRIRAGIRDRALVAGIAVLLGLTASPARAQAPGADLIQRATGLNAPIGLTNAGDGTNRLFIVEQAGCVRFYLNNSVVGAACGQAGTRFLDIRTKIASGGERGLLGLAFPPNYSATGFFYVYYTSVANPNPPARNTGDIVIARYSVTADPNIADPASEAILIVIPHSSQSNHNGGQLAFGPDGFLYAAVGDGGGGGDPFESGQNISTMLGKIHRIDVNNAPTAPFYRIPPTNPFQTGGPNTCATGGCDEIWGFGLRNPWRFSFDRVTGDLYIADVGQGAWEEVNFQTAGLAGGRNYGWDVLEGRHCFEDVPAGSCTAFLNGGSTLPVLEYDHSLGFSITGGFVYRGRVTSALWTGSYVFTDYGSGRIWRGFRDGGGNWQMQQMFMVGQGITSFGEDEQGNLYYVQGNNLFRLYPWSFLDVPPGLAFAPFVERLYASGVTAGCAKDDFCPSASTTREQMAVLAVRAEDRGFVPPPCDVTRFADVPASSPYCPWIEELARRGVVSGCGGGRYCPAAAVTRAEMALFTLGTLEGAGYAPPACATPMFSDVPAASPSCRWIEELARRGVAGGCGGGRFCPDAPVTRGDMSVFLVGGFGLR